MGHVGVRVCVAVRCGGALDTWGLGASGLGGLCQDVWGVTGQDMWGWGMQRVRMCGAVGCEGLDMGG